MLEAINLEDEPPALVKEMLAMNLAGLQGNPSSSSGLTPMSMPGLRDSTGRKSELKFPLWRYRKFGGDVASPGKIPGDIDSKLIMAIFSAIINIDTHKEEIGIDFFPQLLDYLTEFVMQGLTSKAHLKAVEDALEQAQTEN